MSWRSFFGVREHLESASIPTPTSVLADLLLLRLVAIPLDQVRYNDHDTFAADIPLKGGGHIEVQLSTRINGARQFYNLTVGIPGAPVYRSIDLKGTERDRVINAIMQRREQWRKEREAKKDADNQFHAIDAIERLI